MRILVIELGLLLFHLMIITTINPVGIGAKTEDGPSQADNKGNITVSNNRTWSCPDGWVPYVSNSKEPTSGLFGDGEISCLLLGKGARSFHAAETHCQSYGGGLVTFGRPDKEAFVKSKVKAAESGEYWIGLSKDRGYDSVFEWHRLSGKEMANTDSMPQQLKDYMSYKAQCAYISAFNDDMEIDDCEPEYLPLCEKPISCNPGAFGTRCEKECHCVGELCNPAAPEGVTCKWGCQRGWMGVSCDIEKQDPDVKYFCINSPEEVGKYVHIHIYTKGVTYSAIYGLTANKVRGDWCSSTVVSSEPPNTLTVIRIPVTETSIEQMTTGQCVGNKLNENTFSWQIVIKENDGIVLEHDLLVNITCNFSSADSLVRSNKYSLNGEPRHAQHKTFTPESIRDDVSLQIIDAYTGEPVNEGSIGSTVVLQIKYGQYKGSLLKGLFPYNCKASSPDGKYIKELLDENGCQVPNSPVKPFSRQKDNKIQTPWFNLFGFEDEQTVTFHCSFNLCLTSNCNVGCWTPSRLKRDTQDETDDEQHSTTRTIRVLPSIAPQKPAGDSHNSEYQTGKAPSPAGYDIGPFVYLNPVTCTLFLLILLIFMCMYIAFLRTLRKSVYDIRKEIEVKRSRDKFLHCGCVQQKDRDYIVPQIQ